jgi:hypothetical protein
LDRGRRFNPSNRLNTSHGLNPSNRLNTRHRFGAGRSRFTFGRFCATGFRTARFAFRWWLNANLLGHIRRRLCTSGRFAFWLTFRSLAVRA